MTIKQLTTKCCKLKWIQRRYSFSLQAFRQISIRNGISWLNGRSVCSMNWFGFFRWTVSLCKTAAFFLAAPLPASFVEPTSVRWGPRSRLGPRFSRSETLMTISSSYSRMKVYLPRPETPPSPRIFFIATIATKSPAAAPSSWRSVFRDFTTHHVTLSLSDSFLHAFGLLVALFHLELLQLNECLRNASRVLHSSNEMGP